jgi:DNA-binding CsgD family transcriptional regulator
MAPKALSPRQIECLRRIASGETSNDIATALGLSSRTVDHYISNACSRLGVRSRSQAVARAIGLGVIPPDPATNPPPP